jgi:hypothetical protein
MSDATSDDIGDDGTVRLGAYEPYSDIFWFSLICGGRRGCGHIAPFGISPAIARLGALATAGDLARRARCGKCGGRDIRSQLSADTRPGWRVEQEGPLPETRAGALPT